MEPFLSVTGPAASLPLANVDTDVIMPKQFLKGIDRSGLDHGVFYDLRFDSTGQVRPDFVLNRPAWQGARFLVAGPNFGCGSSREHAVWGLLQFGIRAVLGTSFAGIFADNAANNGLLLVSLKQEAIAELAARADDPRLNAIEVDLQAEAIVAPGLNIGFHIAPRCRDVLMNGLDAIGTTLLDAEGIAGFQKAHHSINPWLA